jgi:hypothetical protein
VIVDYLDVVCVSVFPKKANPPLLVNADAVLTVSIASQQLEAITRRRREVANFGSVVDLEQFPPCNQFNGLKLTRSKTMEKPLGFRRPKRLDHECKSITLNVKRQSVNVAGPSRNENAAAWIGQRHRCSGIRDNESRLFFFGDGDF